MASEYDSYEDEAEGATDDGSPEKSSAGLKGPTLEKAIKADAGKSTKVENADVEEAVAQQRRRSSDPYPWRSGYGRTGKREAPLHEYHQLARKNGTSVPAALRDYHSIEEASRASPVLGIEALAQRMGWDAKRVAAEYAQHHFGQDDGRQLTGAATAYNGQVAARNVIAEATHHPANKHLRDEAAVKWMADYLAMQAADGRTVGQHLLEREPDTWKRLQFVYQTYDNALRSHKATQHQAARQRQMDEGAEAERHAYARRVSQGWGDINGEAGRQERRLQRGPTGQRLPNKR